MKLSVMQENLARGLAVVSRAVSNRSTLPVLANVLLKTEDGGLRLTTTNLEIGLVYWVPGKVETDGATTVPARLLTDLVSSLPGGAADRSRDRPERDAARDLRPVPVARQGHRRRRVPVDPADRRATDDPDRPERAQARARGDRLRRRDRRGPARSSPASCAGSRATPSRWPPPTTTGSRSRRSRSSTRSSETSVVVPGAGPHRADADPRRHGRPGRRGARPGPQPDPVPPRGHRPRQPADRRPVPELPVGPAEGPHDAGRPRSRGAAARRPAGGADRPRVGEHREAPDLRERRVRASPSAPTPRSATTSARSRPRSRATAPRSRSTRSTSPTSSRRSTRSSSRWSSRARSRRASSSPIGDDRYVHVVMPVRTTS